MKTRFLLPFLALLSCVSVQAQSGKCLPSRADGVTPWGDGEQLEFTVSYNWYAVQTDVAKAVLAIDKTTLNGEPVWHPALKVQTAPFFDAFFKIRESFESWFALTGVEPRRFFRDSREGDYHAVNKYEFDEKAGVIHAVLEYRDQGETTTEIPYGDCTYDVAALFYFARRMDYQNLKEGSVHKVSIAIDDEILVLNLTYLGQENKYVRGLGTIASRKFGLSVRKGEMFEGNQDVILWFSDDDNRIPVAFMAPLKVGAMNGRLKKTENLAHPFDSFISSKKVK